MDLIVLAIVFIVGLFILNLGVDANVTIEYAILYLASVIAMCTSFITRAIRDLKKDANSSRPNKNCYLDKLIKEFRRPKTSKQDVYEEK